MLELANVYFVGITHFVNVLLLAFLARSGLEILASYPRLYLRDDCKPGTEWLALTRKKIPEGRLWTTLEQEADWSPWLALPGHRNLGLARLWHFLAMVLWIANGLVYYVLLYLSDEWRRLIPTSWSVFPDALHVAATYLRFELPPHGNPYNALQQLSYAAMAFLFPAFMLLTGFALSPAVEARWPRIVRLFRNRQTARSLHFLGLVAMLGFVVVHVALVIIEGFAGNLNYIVRGTRGGDDLTAMLHGISGIHDQIQEHLLHELFDQVNPGQGSRRREIDRDFLQKSIADQLDRVLDHNVEIRFDEVLFPDSAQTQHRLDDARALFHHSVDPAEPDEDLLFVLKVALDDLSRSFDD